MDWLNKRVWIESILKYGSTQDIIDCQHCTLKQNLFQKDSADFLLRKKTLKMSLLILKPSLRLLIREMKNSKFLNLKFISCMDSNVVLYQSQIWLEPFPKANKSLLCNCIFYEKSNKYCNSEMKKYYILWKCRCMKIPIFQKGFQPILPTSSIQLGILAVSANGEDEPWKILHFDAALNSTLL